MGKTLTGPGMYAGKLKAVISTAQSRVEDLEKELGEKAHVDLAALLDAASKAKEVWSQACRAQKKASDLEAGLERLKEQENRPTGYGKNIKINIKKPILSWKLPGLFCASASHLFQKTCATRQL